MAPLLSWLRQKQEVAPGRPPLLPHDEKRVRSRLRAVTTVLGANTLELELGGEPAAMRRPGPPESGTRP